MTHLAGRLIDLHQRRIHPARITIEHGRIADIEETASAPDRVILPGFVDAHIHIESSMLVPSRFARLAVRHGTAAAIRRGKPVDGHAPGLTGDDARRYASAGISTDHECFTLEEAVHKLEAGMKVIIREGSAARNFDALHPLFHQWAGRLMFGSDDKHPDDLLLGHINALAARSVGLGYDLFDVLHAACVAPVEHYRMDVGLLRVGDPADFIVADSERTFNVSQTWIHGRPVFDEGRVSWDAGGITPINRFHHRTVSPEELHRLEDGPVPVIVAKDGEIVTGRALAHPHGDPDVLKLVVVNRYSHREPAIAWITGFGAMKGAIASSVAHDSHNVIAVGSDDATLAEAVNAVMDAGGGISVCDALGTEVLPLPVAGLMSDRPGEEVAEAYQALDRRAKRMGASVAAPYMLLSFMALLVIPSLKLSDQGLFYGETFRFMR